MIKAHYDEKDGRILGFYTDFHEVIPEPTIEITEKQWKSCLTEANKVVDLKTNKLKKVSNSLSLSDERLLYEHKVDSMVGHFRGKVISVATGQELTYKLKAEQAQEYLESSTPSPEDYPFLMEEALILDADMKEVAEGILSKQKSWMSKAAKVEALRLKTKASIRVGKRGSFEELLEELKLKLEEIINA